MKALLALGIIALIALAIWGFYKAERALEVSDDD